MKGKVNLLDLKIEEKVDLSIDENSKYRKEYWGKCVYGRAEDALYIFDTEGKEGCYMGIWEYRDAEGNLLFSPGDLVELVLEYKKALTKLEDLSAKNSEQSKEILKLKEKLSQEKRNEDKIEQLLKLKEKFTIDEIIKLKENELI